jgi:3-deoxy-7-phosphoheptulonate synthase
MRQQTSDLRIRTARPLLSPAILEEELPLSEVGAEFVSRYPREVDNILAGRDDRLIVLVGLKSIANHLGT